MYLKGEIETRDKLITHFRNCLCFLVRKCNCLSPSRKAVAYNKNVNISILSLRQGTEYVYGYRFERLRSFMVPKGDLISLGGLRDAQLWHVTHNFSIVFFKTSETFDP